MSREVSEEPTPSETYPEFTLRVFLSADLVGSTAFKQHKGVLLPLDNSGQTSDVGYQLGPQWTELFMHFFREFPQYITDGWNIILQELTVKQERREFEDIGPPALWKCGGDELIFQSRISRVSQLWSSVFALRYALERFRDYVRGSHFNIDVKGGAWIGQFPIVNSEVVLGQDLSRISELMRLSGVDSEEGQYYSLFKALFSNFLFRNERKPGELMEFIGPQMDIGFRLLEHASPRMLVLSVDLVYLLSLVLSDDSHRHSKSELGNLMKGIYLGEKTPKNLWQTSPHKWELRFLDSRQLKGVLSGIPYPIFWIPGKDDEFVEIEEEKFRGISPKSHDTVREYCEKYSDFLKQKGNGWACNPYLTTSEYRFEDNRDQEKILEHFDCYLSPPVSHELKLKDMQEKFSTAQRNLITRGEFFKGVQQSAAESLSTGDD